MVLPVTKADIQEAIHSSRKHLLGIIYVPGPSQSLQSIHSEVQGELPPNSKE